MAIADYTLPPVQTTQDAQVPNGAIITPTTPAPVYTDPSSIFDSTIQPKSQSEIDANAKLDQYNQLLGIQTQSSQEQAQQFGALGGNEAAAKLADITAQYKAADIQNQSEQQAYLAQTRGIGGYTQTAQTGGMEDINRANAVKKLGLAADAAILQGKVDTAKILSEQAIKAKYGDVQGKIDSIKSFLDVNKDFLSRADAKSLAKQQFVLAAKQKEQDKKIAEETKVSNMVYDAAAQGAPEELRIKAAKAKTPMDAANILGEYAGDYLKNELLRAQIAKTKSEMVKIDNQSSLLKAQPTGVVTAPNGDAIGISDQALTAIGKLKLNEGQANAVAFTSRMIQSAQALDKQLGTIKPTGGFYETSGYDPTSAGSAVGREVGSDQSRVYDTNAKDFIRAKLRKESGATITDEEMEADAQIYVPRGVGLDEKDLILAQTKREEAIKAMIAQAGPAAPYLQQYYEDSKKQQAPVLSSNPQLNSGYNNTSSAVQASTEQAANGGGTYGFSDNQ